MVPSLLNAAENGGGYTMLVDENGGGRKGGAGNAGNEGCCRYHRKHRHWKIKLPLLLGCALLIGWLIIYSASIDTPLNFQPSKSTIAANGITSAAGEGGGNATGREGAGKKFLTECKLPKGDPWDPAIVPFLDPNYFMNWRKECKREYPELTRLLDGYIVMAPEAIKNGTHCQFKCLYPHTDYKFVAGQWTEIGTQPDCDIVETRCQHEKIGNNTFNYTYLHAQIYRRQADIPERKLSKETPKPGGVNGSGPDSGPDQGKRRAPDVHIFILDSVSHPQFVRTMPKTVAWLGDRMEAIPFPHLNKIGLNSKPNGYGMLFGIQAIPVGESPMGPGYAPPRDLRTMSSIYLDNEPFVGFEYAQRNYRTMMAEDWGKGVFNWPGSNGFERQPTDHYMRPFQLRTESGYDPDKILSKIVHDKSCLEPHHHIMRYLCDFIDAYEDLPKFSISWMVEIAHWNVNGLASSICGKRGHGWDHFSGHHFQYRMDADVHQFLRDYEAKLNNSFLFIMGDHGLRFGGIRQTKAGEVEDNNPALFLVLPRHLRHNRRLMENLRDNARQLVTHFDVHATLVNIARQGANMTAHSPFDKLASPLRGPTPHGQSLLYPLDKNVPRNCDTLKIPFEFCQCQFETRNVTRSEPKLGADLAEMIVERMNATLAARKADEKCAKLEVDKKMPVEVVEFEPAQKMDVFKVTLETIPGNGKFWAYMQVQDRGLASHQNYTFISTRFPRLNEYAKQAYCIDDPEISPYCYCKELLLNAAAQSTTPNSLLE